MAETLSNALPNDLEARVSGVLEALCDRGWTVATAESCTGGLFASVLTDVDGLGHAFERGFVTYTDQAKTDDLGVSPDLIADHGVVSAPVAAAMAQGCLDRSTADFALSVTGFAGPGGEDDEEGLVHLALAARDGRSLASEHHFGPLGRGTLRLKALAAGIDLMEAALR